MTLQKNQNFDTSLFALAHFQSPPHTVWLHNKDKLCNQHSLGHIQNFARFNCLRTPKAQPDLSIGAERTAATNITNIYPGTPATRRLKIAQVEILSILQVYCVNKRYDPFHSLKFSLLVPALSEYIIAISMKSGKVSKTEKRSKTKKLGKIWTQNKLQHAQCWENTTKKKSYNKTNNRSDFIYEWIVSTQRTDGLKSNLDWIPTSEKLTWSDAYGRYDDLSILSHYIFVLHGIFQKLYQLSLLSPLFVWLAHTYSHILLTYQWALLQPWSRWRLHYCLW